MARVSDFMGDLVEIAKRMRGTVYGPGTMRHSGAGYRGERRGAAKVEYRRAGKTQEARDLSARLLAARHARLPVAA